MSLRSSYLAVGFALATLSVLAGCENQLTDEQPFPITTTEAPDDVSIPRVLQRDFQVAYELDAVTVQSESVALVAPRGTRLVAAKKMGETVERDAVAATVEIDPSFRAELERNSPRSRIDAAALEALEALPREVAAPVSGIMSEGDRGLFIVSSGIDVVANLSGLQELRVGTAGTSGVAVVETVVGQRSIACSYVWLERSGLQDAAGPTQYRCRLPRTVETVGGLRARISITGPLIPAATLVPDSAIGVDQTGYVVTLMQDGESISIPINVGPSDGVVRVVFTPLPIGAEVLPPPTLR